MKNGFKLSATIPAKPSEIYKAWLSSKGHSAMTGSAAKATAKVGGKFSAWDGYISGRTLELEPDRRIVQAWRTSEFPDDAPDLDQGRCAICKRPEIVVSAYVVARKLLVRFDWQFEALP